MSLRGGAVYEDLTYEEQEHVGVITLRRPEARNALTFRTYAELEDAVRIDDRPLSRHHRRRPRVLLGRRREGRDGRRRAASGRRARLLAPRVSLPRPMRLLHTDVPVVAAVNGAAVGWGMELSLMADFRVASEKAKFGELFVLRGLVSDAPGLGRLAQLVGREKAAELLMTGEVIDAAEALRIGLVGRVVPHDELLPTALGLAQRIAANPPLAVQAIKRGLRQALDPDWNEARRVGQLDARRAVPDRGPPRGRALVPREARRRNFIGR